jgi:hypothetical protein
MQRLPISNRKKVDPKKTLEAHIPVIIVLRNCGHWDKVWNPSKIRVGSKEAERYIANALISTLLPAGAFIP